MISARTKAALAAARARGTVLGGNRGSVVDNAARAASIASRTAKASGRASDLAPIVAEIRTAGASSLRDIAAGLNGRGVTAPRGGEWSAAQVRTLLAKID